jgi:hypothetical protein
MVTQPVLETKRLKCRRNLVASWAWRRLPTPQSGGPPRTAGALENQRVMVVTTRAAPASTQHP